MRRHHILAAIVAATSTIGGAMAQTPGTSRPGNSLDEMFPPAPRQQAAPVAPMAPPAPAAPVQARPAVPATPAAAPAVRPPAAPPATRESTAPQLPPFLANPGGQPPQPVQVVQPTPAGPQTLPQVLAGPGPQAPAPQIVPPAPPPTPARDIVVTDDETNQHLESLNRQQRVLNAELAVEKARGEVAKAQVDLRKAQDGLRPTPTPDQITALTQPAPQPVVVADPAREASQIAQRMSVLSISGVEGRLTATVLVAGYGEVKVRQGGMLPGGLSVTSVTSQGVAVSRSGTRPILLSFSR